MSDEQTLFICHASEDKELVARPLAEELRRRGVKVWYDEWSLSIGDSLSRTIDKGLLSSRYGVVILSRKFFEKEWPQRELTGLSQKEIGGEKVILPIWHKVDRDYIASQSPTLADRLALSTDLGVETLALRIVSFLSSKGGSEEKSDKVVQPSPPAVVSIGFDFLVMRPELHHYRLTVTVELLVPPDQGRVRFRLRWPFIVPLLDSTTETPVGREVENGSIQSHEFVINWEERIYPGEKTQIIGPMSSHRINYRFDDRVYRDAEKIKPVVEYALYLEDHLPVHGSLPIRSLHSY